MKSFSYRILRRMHRRDIPSVFLFLDTETKAFRSIGGDLHRFYLGWTYNWIRSARCEEGVGRWRFFLSEGDLNRYIRSTAEDLGEVLLLGHNIYFDLQAAGFFRYFTDWGWRLDFYYDRGMTYIMRVSKGSAALMILSTTNWFDCSLDELGELIGIKKGKVDFEKATDTELKEYCRRDVEIIVSAVRYYINFILENDLGRFSLTKASQAMTAYRTRFMSHNIYLHDVDVIKELERKAYIGGRVEAFRIGELEGEGFASLDVNSMYPYVMKKYEYPYRLTDYSEDITVSRLTDIVKTFSVVCEAEITTAENAYAVQMSDKTIFPVGSFRCFLCTQGTLYALKKGHMTRVVRAAVYRRADLFSEYVDYLYDMRLKYETQGNEVMAKLCKYLHNSLYGKFGQRRVVTEMKDNRGGHQYYREEIYDPGLRTWIIQTYIMNRLIIQYSEGEGKKSFTAIAAHITENARMELWALMNLAGLDKALYCDTDSIKIRESDITRLSLLIRPGELGALKVEELSKTLEIGGAKNYKTENKRCIKGVPASAIEVEPGVYSFTSFAGQATHMKEGIIEGFRTKVMTRTLAHSYDKGIVAADGKVSPFVLYPAPEVIPEAEIPF